MPIGMQVEEIASKAEQAADETLFSEEGDVKPVSGGEEGAEEEEAPEDADTGDGEEGEEGGEGGAEEEEEEGEGDVEEEESEEEEEEEVEEEEEKEEKKVEERDEEKKDEKPAKKRIYDETFEKFPKLKEAFDRDKAYREVFATPDDAKEAVTDLARYERMAVSLEQGNPLGVFNALFNKDPQIVAKLAANFIPSLLQVNPTLAARAGLPAFNAILAQAKATAQNYEGTAKSNLENSVDHLCKLIHGKPYDEWLADQKNAPKADPRVEQLEQQLAQERQKEFDNYYNRTADTCYRRLDRLIALSVTKLPGLSVLERKALTRFVKDDVTEMLDKDRAHNTRMGAIWRRVMAGGLKDEQMSEVINAFLGGAKPLMKSVLAKRLVEARKGRRPVKGGGAGAPPRVPAGGGAQGLSGKGHVGPIDINKVNFRQTSDMDLFDGKITFKK